MSFKLTVPPTLADLGLKKIYHAESEADSEGAPFFGPVISFLCNHFEELQTVLFGVELSINNAPLTYLNPNTIETCLIPNH